jgi:hypothetical protein
MVISLEILSPRNRTNLKALDMHEMNHGHLKYPVSWYEKKKKKKKKKKATVQQM